MTNPTAAGASPRTAVADDSTPYCVYEAYIGCFAEPEILVEQHVLGENIAIAYHLEKFNSIGMDCVANCVNRLVAAGAIPTAFTAEVPDAFREQLIPGFIEGCIHGCCTLDVNVTSLGKVTGTAVGMYDRREKTGQIRPGNVLIGLLSSGFHDEALVKVSRILQLDDENIRERVPELFCKMEDELFRPAKIYTRPVLHISRTLGLPINGMCFVGESGLTDSIYDMLPDGVSAKLLPENFPMSGIYEMIARRGHLGWQDMFANFNMGIGLVMAVDRKRAGDVMSNLIQIGEHPYVIGACFEGERDVELKW